MRNRQLFHWKWWLVLVLFAFLIQFYQHVSAMLDLANSNGSSPVRDGSHPSTLPVLPHSNDVTSSTPARLPRLLIAGTVRNVEPHLSKIRKAIARLLTDHFQLVQMIWFENNSNDGTVRELQRWNTTHHGWNTKVLTTSNNLSPVPQRTERLAHGRNRLWKEIQSMLPIVDNRNDNESIEVETYILMMDMDDVNWHLSNAHECLNLFEWSVCCCNSYKVYYDLWALRTTSKEDTWMPGDANAMLGGRQRRHKPFRHISASHAPIPVASCFGGAALYKYSVIRKVLQAANENNESLYSGTDSSSGKPVCEHLSFHEKIVRYLTSTDTNYAASKNSTSGLYIQPKFLNDGPADERMLYFGSVKKRFEVTYRRSWNDTNAKQYYDAMMINNDESR